MASEIYEGLSSQGELAARISAEMVSLEKLHGGKGPTKCKTYIEDNLILVLFGGGFTAAEHTASESGRFVDVRRMKLAYQDAMEVRFTEKIEELTGREVKAFMSASHQDPDLVLEAFILEPLAEPPADE
jgi:uncharacterized protein YbcI